MSQFTILTLAYGDYPDLIERCLRSILSRLPSPHVAELRVGLNAVSNRTFETVVGTIDSDKVPTRVYNWRENRCKYPVLRDWVLGMDSVRTDYVCWFDDDSCLRPTAPHDFFGQCVSQLADVDIVGCPMRCKLEGNQHVWITRQPWYTGRPVAPEESIRFIVGGWWLARTDVFRTYGWPPPELRHRGGDVMFGALAAQQGLRIRGWHHGVAINANSRLDNHTSPRRGVNERPVGFTCRA